MNSRTQEMGYAISGSFIEAYVEFHTKWKEEQEQQTEELRAALDADLGEDKLRDLVRKVEKHYEDYYGAKEGAVREDVLTMLQPTWKSPLETAFMWIGGWRPTMVFQLAYAQAGQHLEAELAELLQGLDTPSMASLSAKQLQRISDLQVATRKTEDEITHRLAFLQQGLVDQPLLSLVTAEVTGEHLDDGQHASTVTDAMDEKVKGLEELCHDADDLRCDTLKKMLKILTPTQAAQYLVAAAQLQMAIRRVGKAKVDKNNHKNGEDREQDEDGPTVEPENAEANEKQDS